MLVELCGKVYEAQGHTGAHHWIEMLPQPYQSHMWAELEKLDTPMLRKNTVSARTRLGDKQKANRQSALYY